MKNESGNVKKLIFRNKRHVWHPGMTTYNGLVAFIMYIMKIKTICDPGDLTELKSDEKCARSELVLVNKSDITAIIVHPAASVPYKDGADTHYVVTAAWKLIN